MAGLLGYSQRVQGPASRPRQPLAGSEELCGAGVASSVMRIELHAHNIDGSPSAPLVPPARSFLQPRTAHIVLRQLAVSLQCRFWSRNRLDGMRGRLTTSLAGVFCHRRLQTGWNINSQNLELERLGGCDRLELNSCKRRKSNLHTARY